MRIIDFKSTGEFLNSIRRHAIKKDIHYIAISILLIAQQTGFIFSQELSEIYFMHELDEQKRIGTIMSQESSFNKISSYFDVKKHLRRLATTWLLLVFLLILLALCTLVLVVARFDILKKILGIDRSRQRKYIISLLSFIILNYDIFFFMINLLAINSFICRTIFLEQIISTEDSYLEQASSDNSQHYVEENKYVIENMIPQSVSSISNNIACLSLNHLLLGVLSTGIILGNFAIKLAASRMMKYVPSREIFFSKVGDADLFHDFVLVIIITSNSALVRYTTENYLIFRLQFYSYLALLSAAYFVNYLFRPFLNSFQHNLKSFQILYLLMLTFFSILVRESNLQFIRTEVITIISMMLGMTVLLKFNSNFSRIRFAELFIEIKGVKSISEKKIIMIYYLLIEHIDSLIRNEFESGQVKLSNPEIIIFIEFMFKEHKKTCQSLNCFCNEPEIFRSVHKLGFLDKKLSNKDIIDIMLLLENLLHKAVLIANNNSGTVWYCYLYYIINFMGKSYDAFLLIQKKITSNKIGNLDASPEDSALLDNINIAVRENLDAGYLCLRKYPELLNESTIDSRKTTILPHILFLNNFMEYKKRVSKCTTSRRNFLKELQATGNLKVMYSISNSFYDTTKRIHKDYKRLRRFSNGSFGPLLLVHSWYLHFIYQRRQLSIKLQAEYLRKYDRFNLNKIFGGSELIPYEFACIYVGRHKESKQTIRYSTSNLIGRLGYAPSELEGRDLGIIIPQPIRRFHQSFFDNDKNTGRWFMKKDLMKTYPLHKNGYLVRCNIGLRLNCRIDKGIEIIGILQFERNTEYERLAIIDRHCNVTAITESLNQIIPKDGKFSNLNKEFENTINSMNIVVAEKMTKLEKSMDSEYAFLGDNHKHWAIYFGWRRSKTINIISIDHEVIKINLNLSEMIVQLLKEFYYIAKIEPIEDLSQKQDNRIILDTEQKEQSQPIRIQHKLLTSILPKSMEDIKEGSIPDEKGNDEDSNGIGHNKHKYMVGSGENKREMQLVSRMTKYVFSREYKSIKHKISQHLQESVEEHSVSAIAERSLSKVAPGFSSRGVAKIRAGSKIKSSLKNTIKEKKMTMINAKPNEKTKVGQSSGSSITVYSTKDLSTEEIIHNCINPIQVHSPVVVTILMLLFLYMLDAICIRIKIPMQEKTSADLREQLITADIISWIIWSNLYNGYYIDLMRGIKEGKIKNNLVESYDIPDLIEWAHNEYLLPAAYQYEPSKIADMKIRNLTFPSLFAYDDWIGTKMEMDFYELDQVTNQIKWSKIQVSRMESTKILTALSLSFQERNYSILEGEEGYIQTIGEDRNADPDEEFLRRNSNGDVNYKFFLRSLDFYQYLKNVALQNQKYVLYSMLLSTSISICLALGYAVYLLNELLAMRRFYGQIFNLEVSLQ